MATNTYQPDDSTGLDTYLDQANPTTNYGGNATMTFGDVFVKSDGFEFPLLEFDISDITAGSTVTSASLDLFAESVVTGGFDSRVQRIVRSDWSESQATWNIYKTGNDWSTTGARHDGNDISTTNQVTFTATTGSGSFTISGLGTLAQDALDTRSGKFRFKLFPNFSGSSKYMTLTSSGGATSANRPKLTVNYTVPAATNINRIERKFSRGVLRGVGRGR